MLLHIEVIGKGLFIVEAGTVSIHTTEPASQLTSQPATESLPLERSPPLSPALADQSLIEEAPPTPPPP